MSIISDALRKTEKSRSRQDQTGRPFDPSRRNRVIPVLVIAALLICAAYIPLKGRIHTFIASAYDSAAASVTGTTLAALPLRAPESITSTSAPNKTASTRSFQSSEPIALTSAQQVNVPPSSGSAQVAVEVRPLVSAAAVTPQGATGAQFASHYRLMGVVLGSDGYHAVINNRVVRKGDLLQDGVRVIRIDKRSATLSANGKEVLIEKMF